MELLLHTASTRRLTANRLQLSFKSVVLQMDKPVMLPVLVAGGEKAQERAPRLTQDLDSEAVALVREEPPLCKWLWPSNFLLPVLLPQVDGIIADTLPNSTGQRAKACIDNTDFMAAVNTRPPFNMWIYGCVWPMYLQALRFLLYTDICPHNY